MQSAYQRKQHRANTHRACCYRLAGCRDLIDGGLSGRIVVHAAAGQALRCDVYPTSHQHKALHRFGRRSAPAEQREGWQGEVCNVRFFNDR